MKKLVCIKNYITDGETFTQGKDYQVIEDCGDNSMYTLSNEGNRTWLDLDYEETEKYFIMEVIK